MGLEYHCLNGEGQNSNVYKNRARIPVFERTGPEYQCLKGQGWNSNVYKNKARIPVFERKGPEQQSLNGQGQNSNVYKNRARMQIHLCDAAGMCTLHGLNWKHPETHNSSGNQDVRQLPLGQGLGGQRIELHPHYPLVRMKRFMSWNEKLKPPQLGSTVMMWYVLLLTNLAISLDCPHKQRENRALGLPKARQLLWLLKQCPKHQQSPIMR